MGGQNLGRRGPNKERRGALALFGGAPQRGEGAQHIGTVVQVGLGGGESGTIVEVIVHMYHDVGFADQHDRVSGRLMRRQVRRAR